MGIFDKLNKSSCGYIFLSHSHSDIEQVRKIRNRLEDDGFEPLCFYLKCLDDDSEIEELIKREIDAREWFVFVDSENSRKSKWVTLEREYITRTNRKKILTVDLHDSHSISTLLNKITHHLRVYIAYSGRDFQLAQRIQRKLAEKDYLVFTPADNPDAGTIFSMKTIRRAIREASKEGCVIGLLSADSVQYGYTRFDLIYAIRKGGNVIPVFIGDVQPDDYLAHFLSNKQTYSLSQNPTDEEIEGLIDQIGQSIAKK